MLIEERPTPWYRDRGLLASTGFAAAIVVFTHVTAESPSDQVNGVLAAAPMLAATLVERPIRVVTATLIALVAALEVSWGLHVSWDAAQSMRIAAIAVSGAIGFVAADVRIRDKRKLVGMREVARTAQRAIMRVDPPRVPGIDAAVRYVSATEQAHIGGDAYEAVTTPFGLRVLVADARGKGIPAVRSSALTLGSFREWAHLEPELGDLLARMDASLSREVNEWDFVTALVAELHGSRLRFCSAGHPMPLLVRDGRVRLLGLQASPPLSLMLEAGPPQTGQIQLRAGDVVFMFTDGLTDARDSNGEYFPLEGLLPELASRDSDLGGIIDELLDRLRTFVHSDLDDDVAMVMLRVTEDFAPNAPAPAAVEAVPGLVGRG